MNGEASLQSLAEEILVHIFKYLPTVDVVSLSTVCRRFQSICSDKSITRISNLSCAFKLTESLFKMYLQPKVNCSNIEILNLNYCFWLPLPIFNLLSKLTNLKELHVLDCQVSFAVLRKILSEHHLRALSWTWRSPVKTKNSPAFENFDSMRDYLSYLRHLVIHISCSAFMMDIRNFALACSNLEGLEIYNLNVPFQDVNKRPVYSQFHRQITSPVKTLHYLKCHDFFKELFLRKDLYYLVKYVSSFANSMAQWKCLWITEMGSQVMHEWWGTNLLLLEELSSVDALNLSGYWPHMSQLNGYTQEDYYQWNELFRYKYNQGAGHTIGLLLLNHVADLKCRKLSFDDSGLTPELLCAIALKCPNLEYLSMSRCLVLDINYMDKTGRDNNIIDGFNRLCMNCSRITNLDLTKTEIAIQYSALAHLKSLTSLGISTWMLASDDKQLYPKNYSKDQSAADPVHKRFNQPEITEEVLQKTRMWQIFEACPRLVKLAIKDIQPETTFDFYIYTILDAEYACISKFKQLKHLWIQDTGYLGRGACMKHILEGCTELITLRLLRFGRQKACNYIPHLTSALTYAKSLKSMSIMQSRVHLPALFFNELSKCCNLERFKFSLVTEDEDLPNRIYSLARNLPKLNWMQVHLKSSKASWKELDSRLARFAKERQCFTFSILNDGKRLPSNKENPPYVYLDGFSEY